MNLALLFQLNLQDTIIELNICSCRRFVSCQSSSICRSLIPRSYSIHKIKKLTISTNQMDVDEGCYRAFAANQLMIRSLLERRKYKSSSSNRSNCDTICRTRKSIQVWTCLEDRLETNTVHLVYFLLRLNHNLFVQWVTTDERKGNMQYMDWFH